MKLICENKEDKIKTLCGKILRFIGFTMKNISKFIYYESNIKYKFLELEKYGEELVLIGRPSKTFIDDDGKIDTIKFIKYK